VEPRLKFIAVEGVIGVGKTGLATRLASAWGAECVVEEIESNPFLERFYEDLRSYAFQTQLFFLFARHRQQLALAQRNLFSERVVTDYLFEKDRIFAYLNLDEAEITLYEKIYRFLEKDIIRPDMVVYLQARPEFIYERIKLQGRGFERDISLEYLTALTDAYNRFFFHLDSVPSLLIVNAEHIDPVHNSRDFDGLFREILRPAPGRRYYSPEKLWGK
jgi:deoxyadenosine/deoxycytidine kinase